MEGQTLVVDIDELRERITRRMVHEPALAGAGRLDLLPHGLGGREGVVAVAHGEKERRRRAVRPPSCVRRMIRAEGGSVGQLPRAAAIAPRMAESSTCQPRTRPDPSMSSKS